MAIIGKDMESAGHKRVEKKWNKIPKIFHSGLFLIPLYLNVVNYRGEFTPVRGIASGFGYSSYLILFPHRLIPILAWPSGTWTSSFHKTLRQKVLLNIVIDTKVQG